MGYMWDAILLDREWNRKQSAYEEAMEWKNHPLEMKAPETDVVEDDLDDEDLDDEDEFDDEDEDEEE